MECNKRGYVVLTDSNHEHVMRTVCKTWRCEPCAKKMSQMYKLRTQYGYSGLERCALITLTYVLGSRRPVGAESAVVDLRKLWQRMRSRDRWKNLAWCRVTELTQKGQVHHHLMIGGVNGEFRCKTTLHSRNRGYANWYRRGCTSEDECLNHELAREWERVTTDSYVVDVDRVKSGSRVADYLSKYLVKDIAHWDTLEGLGFKRRWNCSRNFPSPGRLRLTGSQDANGDSEWETVVRIGKKDEDGSDKYGYRTRERSDCPNLVRVGVDLGAPGRKKYQLGKIEKLLRSRDASSKETVYADPHRAGTG